MIDYVYEVRGTDDPIEGDKVRFRTKDEAMAYYEESKAAHPNAAVYIVEYEFDDYEGADNMTSIPEQKDVVQIAGPDVDTINTPDGFPDTCAGDKCDNYDDKGMFRLPKYSDGLDWGDDIDESLVEAADEEEDIPDDFDGIMDFLKADEDEAISGYKKAIAKVDDKFVRDQLDKIATEEEAHKDYLEKVVDDHTVEYTEPLDDEDDIETESFVEELFSALSDKRDERAFPDGKLDLKAPHKDVPVVKCKITPAVTHSEDEKPLKEWVVVNAADRSDEFFQALDDESHSAQMYVAREIVYSLVDDEASARKLAAWGETLDLDEQSALESLIADALEAVDEHEAAWDYRNGESLPLSIAFDVDDTGKQNMDALLASCKSEQEKRDLLLQAMDCLISAGLLY